MNLSSSLLWSN
jgi:(p)ppGpp synthase/HD superfamily hydrolase